MNTEQLKTLIRQGFALNNIGVTSVEDVDRVLANAMASVRRLVEMLPEEGLLRNKAWKDLEPLVRTELGEYAKKLEGSLTQALADGSEDMADVAIRQARHAGADFGPEAVTLGGPLEGTTVQMALNSKVNGKTLRKLFAVDPRSGRSSVSESYFKVVDQEVQRGIIQGTPTEEIAREIAKVGTQRGITGVDLNDANASRKIRNQARAMARTAAQDMNRQVRDAVYDANADAMEGMVWQFSTALDSRTCPTCQPLDGLTEPNKRDLPSWPIHVNCRCQVLPIDPEDDFWKDDTLTAQVIRPYEKGAYKGGYKTPIEINGKKFYRKAVPVRSEDGGPTTYSDVLGYWAKNSQQSLYEAMGKARGDIFIREYNRMNADPQQILTWMLQGDRGAQKFIPIDQLREKEPLKFRRRK